MHNIRTDASSLFDKSKLIETKKEVRDKFVHSPTIRNDAHAQIAVKKIDLNSHWLIKSKKGTVACSSSRWLRLLSFATSFKPQARTSMDFSIQVSFHPFPHPNPEEQPSQAPCFQHTR